MKKFEYQVYRSFDLSEEKLQQMGKWGWQLQAIHDIELKYGAPNTYYFMREIDAPRKPSSRTSTKKKLPASDKVSASRKRRTR